MKFCSAGSIFIAGQIPNPIAAWKSRITCIEVTERGFKFRRENPFYEGETFVLDQTKLDESLWIPARDEPKPLPTANYWAIRFPCKKLPSWDTLSETQPPTQLHRELVTVTVTPVS